MNGEIKFNELGYSLSLCTDEVISFHDELGNCIRFDLEDGTFEKYDESDFNVQVPIPFDMEELDAIITLAKEIGWLPTKDMD